MKWVVLDSNPSGDGHAALPCHPTAGGLNHLSEELKLEKGFF
ncbi:MAG: hypothetical protein WCL21_15905 [Mariniphaga sp.]